MEKLRLCDISNAWAQKMAIYLSAGFHRELRLGAVGYVQSFVPALVSAFETTSPTGLVAFVDLRIPAFRQAELLGLSVDPAVFNEPRHCPQAQPYCAWMEIVPRDGELPPYLRPASVFDALGGDPKAILAQAMVTLPGGDFLERNPLLGGSPRSRLLTLETHLGIPRLGQVPARLTFVGSYPSDKMMRQLAVVI